MRIGVLVHSYTGWNEVLGLECWICDHGEDIDDIMWEAWSSIISIFSVVVHLELSAWHLGDAIVDCLTSVDGCLEVSILKREQCAWSLSSLIPCTVIYKDAQMHSRGNRHRFRQYSNSIAQFCHWVSSWLWWKYLWFGADRWVDGCCNEGFIAVLILRYTFSPKSEKLNRNCLTILFIWYWKYKEN